MSKRSLGGQLPSSKVKGWVEPSFGELFGAANLSRPAGESRLSKAQFSAVDSSGTKLLRKRKVDPSSSELQSLSSSSLSRELVQRDHDEPWVDQYNPRSQAELAVHRKKIEEVENWIRTHSTGLQTTRGGAILLLTGPSGCGKSATVRVLAQEQGLRVQEWTNPSSLSEYKRDPDTYTHTFDPSSRFNGFHGASQTGQFQEFLLRANKYNCLQMDGGGGASQRKLIVVEDFPNQFYRNPGSMHDILRRFVRTGRQPLVFIMSDSLSGDSSSRLLFPKDIQKELSVSHISFNPVAPTCMMKVLSRIAALEAGKSGGKMAVPDKGALELLCSGSSGDIRSAINSLQFSSYTGPSLTRGPRLKTKDKAVTSLRGSKGKRGRRKEGEREEEQAIGGKDASLFLFRALGKILYCKRDSDESTESSVGPALPSHLAEHHRHRMLLDPECVVERSHMSGEFFSLYLHQNYLDFFSDVRDVARASDYLSDADFLTADWNSRDSMGLYGSSVATRGLLHSNSALVSAGFRPLHKPGWLQVNKKYRENCLAAQSLFTNLCVTPVSLQTEMLPYLALLTNSMRNQAQIAFIQDVGRLSQTHFPARQRLEALTDGDPGAMEQDSEEEGPECSRSAPASSNLSGDPGGHGEPPLEDSQGPASQPQPPTIQALLEEEEELLIEEYNSD